MKKTRAQITKELQEAKKEMAQTSLYLRKDLFLLLKKYCKVNDLKVSEVLNHLLEDFLQGFKR